MKHVENIRTNPSSSDSECDNIRRYLSEQGSKLSDYVLPRLDNPNDTKLQEIENFLKDRHVALGLWFSNARYGNADVIKNQFTQGSPKLDLKDLLYTEDDTEATVLMVAAYNRHANIVSIILENTPEDMRERVISHASKNGNTLLTMLMHYPPHICRQEELFITDKEHETKFIQMTKDVYTTIQQYISPPESLAQLICTALIHMNNIHDKNKLIMINVVLSNTSPYILNKVLTECSGLGEDIMDIIRQNAQLGGITENTLIGQNSQPGSTTENTPLGITSFLIMGLFS